MAFEKDPGAAPAPRVLITGANRGVGLALAQHYRLLGWTVIGCCRNPQRASELWSIGEGIEVRILDMASPQSINNLSHKLDERPIDVVIANAGIQGDSRTLGNLDSDDFLATMRVNALGPLLLAESLATRIGASGRKRFIAIGSRMGSIANGLEEGGDVGYRCSKAALNMVIATLAYELKSTGIITAAIHPGWAMTDMGGPDADVPVADSAAGIVRVVEGLTTESSGRLFSWTGETIPW